MQKVCNTQYLHRLWKVCEPSGAGWFREIFMQYFIISILISNIIN